MRKTDVVLSELQSAWKRAFIDIVASFQHPETIDDPSPNDGEEASGGHESLHGRSVPEDRLTNAEKRPAFELKTDFYMVPLNLKPFVAHRVL